MYVLLLLRVSRLVGFTLGVTLELTSRIGFDNRCLSLYPERASVWSPHGSPWSCSVFCHQLNTVDVDWLRRSIVGPNDPSRKAPAQGAPTKTHALPRIRLQRICPSNGPSKKIYFHSESSLTVVLGSTALVFMCLNRSTSPNGI